MQAISHTICGIPKPVTYLLARLPTHKSNQIIELLPHRWQPAS
jgi:hypothetical protein